MTFDVDRYLQQCYNRELLPSIVIKELCERIKEILINDSNVRQIHAPVALVGDIHGQFYDLLEIFKIGGRCPDRNYIFLGDYVDRGYYSVEVISLLCCLKLRYPNRITLVRGNHESRAVTTTYGFYAECERKYGDVQVWRYFTDLFDYFILAVEIDKTILCVHGGLSPSIHTIDQIRVIDRYKEIPHEGPMADLVWSDPVSSFTSEDDGMFAASPRGAGYVFEMNNLGHICRAHQICMEGYQILFDDMLSTVWSAPNYCYRAGNLASILEIGPELDRFFNVFKACPDAEREIHIAEPYNRLDDIFDVDGIGRKRRELSMAGRGISHSLFTDEEEEEYLMTNLTYSTTNHWERLVYKES